MEAVQARSTPVRIEDLAHFGGSSSRRAGVARTVEFDRGFVVFALALGSSLRPGFVPERV